MQYFLATVGNGGLLDVETVPHAGDSSVMRWAGVTTNANSEYLEGIRGGQGYHGDQSGQDIYFIDAIWGMIHNLGTHHYSVTVSAHDIPEGIGFSDARDVLSMHLRAVLLRSLRVPRPCPI